MSRAANPFKARTVLGLLAVGALSFLLLLYAIGQGWTGQDDRNGGAHAASNGLTGFAGLVQLLEARGHVVELARSQGRLDDYGLLVLTPPHFADGEEIAEIIEERRAMGPTVLVLPKWQAAPVPELSEIEAEQGWVVLGEPVNPGWFEQLGLGEDAQLALGETRGWNGGGRSGTLPRPDAVQALLARGETGVLPIYLDGEGDVLAGEVDEGWLGGEDDYSDWPVLIVFEPDLVNNFGMADLNRARLAVSTIERLADDSDMPIVFDMTLAGLGSTENLLTLAFRPPFLAATLCLLLAALVIAWRGLLRFGPAIAEAPAMAQGKRQLARNGASLVAQLKRFHLLKDPYESLVERRIARTLGIKSREREARIAGIERALAAQGHDGPTFSAAAADLHNARGAREIVRAAEALKSIERTLQR